MYGAVFVVTILSIKDTSIMHEKKNEISREQLAANLNEDLAREYQAIISYVIYSQVIKGAQFMSVAKDLVTHAGEELAHALMIAVKQIDYLGAAPVAVPKPVRDVGKSGRHAALRS